MILKGQNFRILVSDNGTYKCVGMATSCTVSLTNNTEEASTKDDVGMASKPTMVSQSWSVSVESLNVQDTPAMLTAIKSLTPFTLIWDETGVSDNQSPELATYARRGTAYLNDATFTFNDRENSSKSLQFTGTSALEKLTQEPSYAAVSGGAYTKGQFVRLFLSDNNTDTPTAVIASARQLSLHVSLTLENATTKDTQGNWQIQEPTGLSYDISTSALVRGNDTITSSVDGQDFAALEDIFEAAAPVKWFIANVSGDNQRTKGTVIVSGSVIVTQLQVNAANRTNAEYSATLQGFGAYTVGA